MVSDTEISATEQPDTLQGEVPASRNDLNGELHETTLPMPADEQGFSKCKDLYRATRSNDLRKAKKILEEEPALLDSPITLSKETVLHVAVGANRVKFVKWLVEEKHADITVKDVNDNTPFIMAAMVGGLEIIKILQRKDTGNVLLLTPDPQGVVPVLAAAMYGRSALASKLYDASKENLKPLDISWLFFTCLRNDIFDLAFKILDKFGDNLELYLKPCDGETALHILARKPVANSSFSLGNQGIRNQLLSCWYSHFSSSNHQQRLLNELLSRISRRNWNDIINYIRKPHHLLFVAAEHGNYNFVGMLIKWLPDIIWENDGNKSIFHIAIENRNEKIFKLIHDTGIFKCTVQSWKDDNTGNNILHFAARLPSKEILNSVRGEALQMRNEFLWFKKMENFAPTMEQNKKNKKNKTPVQVFNEEHYDLMKGGEKWIKENANSGFLVAILIMTIVFPAAFSISDGKKNHLTKDLIYSSFVANAISMGFSTISLLAFLCILISRYTEKDFYLSLLIKFSVGLISLLVSLVAMIVSFGIVTYANLVNEHDY